MEQLLFQRTTFLEPVYLGTATFSTQLLFRKSYSFTRCYFRRANIIFSQPILFSLLQLCFLLSSLLLILLMPECSEPNYLGVCRIEQPSENTSFKYRDLLLFCSSTCNPFCTQNTLFEKFASKLLAQGSFEQGHLSKNVGVFN